MPRSANALRWSGQAGHYEVYYITLNDPDTGLGLWIRYTMLSPLPGSGHEPSCALWFAVMDPAPGAREPVLARKASFPVERLAAREDPFRLDLAGASLTDEAMAGALEDAWWDLKWRPAARAHRPVHPALERLGLAQTVFAVPQADVAIDGSVGFGQRRIDFAGARGGQAHLWGTKHARNWTWARCSDLVDSKGNHVSETFFDGVSAVVTRFGRQFGPNTPMVGWLAGRELRSTSPLRILSNRSRFDVDGWEFEARGPLLKVVGAVSVRRELLAGVTYHDPDGQEAYCYNSETASVKLEVYQRRGGIGWIHAGTLASPDRCHFEYAQRMPVPGLELILR